MSRSATRAASSAPSAWTETKACTARSTFSIRSRQAWVSSTGETARDSTALPAAPRRLERPLSMDGDEGVHGAVDLLDPVETGLGQLNGRDGAGLDGARGVGQRYPGPLGSAHLTPPRGRRES